MLRWRWRCAICHWCRLGSEHRPLPVCKRQCSGRCWRCVCPRVGLLVLRHCMRPWSLQLCCAAFHCTANSSRCCCRIGTLAVTNSNFTSNAATGDGGGLYLSDNLRQTISGSTFTANSASSESGSVQKPECWVLSASSLRDMARSALRVPVLRLHVADGGGIAANNATSALSLSAVTLRSNRAASGGGLFLSQMPNGTALDVTGSTITVRLGLVIGRPCRACCVPACARPPCLTGCFCGCRTTPQAISVVASPLSRALGSHSRLTLQPSPTTRSLRRCGRDCKHRLAANLLLERNSRPRSSSSLHHTQTG